MKNKTKQNINNSNNDKNPQKKTKTKPRNMIMKSLKMGWKQSENCQRGEKKIEKKKSKNQIGSNFPIAHRSRKSLEQRLNALSKIIFNLKNLDPDT